MSLETAIATIVKETVQSCVEFRPVYADKKRMAEILGTSTRMLDRLMMTQKLIEEKHYTRFTDGGHPMFVVKLVVAELKPLLANLEDMI